MLRRLLDRPIAVTMTTIVLVILGIVSSRLLPISLVPDVDAPYITIQIPAQGISARQLNETVITPLRQQLIQSSQLVDLRSEARRRQRHHPSDVRTGKQYRLPLHRSQ